MTPSTLALIALLAWALFLFGVFWPLLWAYGHLEQSERPNPPERRL